MCNNAPRLCLEKTQHGKEDVGRKKKKKKRWRDDDRAEADLGLNLS